MYDTDGNGKLQYSEMNNFMKDLLLKVDTSKARKKKGMTEKEMIKYSQDVTDLLERYITNLIFILSISEHINVCKNVTTCIL